VYNVSQAFDAQPDRINVFYHEASGDRRPRNTLRAEAATYATRGGRGVRAEAAAYAKLATIVNEHHVSYACTQSSCAHHAPHYTDQALVAREKTSVVLPHAFGLPAIVVGWTWCATSTASAAAASTAPTPMHSPAHRRLRKALRR
jgi:hypothetical protein